MSTAGQCFPIQTKGCAFNEILACLLKVKFLLSCHVVYLKVAVVIDHMLSTSGTNLNNLMKRNVVNLD